MRYQIVVKAMGLRHALQLTDNALGILWKPEKAENLEYGQIAVTVRSLWEYETPETAEYDLNRWLTSGNHGQKNLLFWSRLEGPHA